METQSHVVAKLTTVKSFTGHITKLAANSLQRRSLSQISPGLPSQPLVGSQDHHHPLPQLLPSTMRLFIQNSVRLLGDDSDPVCGAAEDVYIGALIAGETQVRLPRLTHQFLPVPGFAGLKLNVHS